MNTKCRIYAQGLMCNVLPHEKASCLYQKLLFEKRLSHSAPFIAHTKMAENGKSTGTY